MDKDTAIRSFVDKRPESLGVYGYGSGVFKQVGYSLKSHPQIDVILLVDDLREWHQQNLKMNSSDYSIMGRIHVNINDLDKLKGYNKINYYSHIKDGNLYFKYGVMEEKDFISFLSTWRSIFVAGRFHKPTLEIKGNDKEHRAIEENRRQAMFVAALLSPPIVYKKEFLKTVCNLSYIGSIRMNIAENPHKVENIVNGCMDDLASLYDMNLPFISFIDNDRIFISHRIAMAHVKELPLYLVIYLYKNVYDFSSLEDIRTGIVAFFTERNKVEEYRQFMDGISTNGIVRSVPYVLSKVKKRIIKQ